MDVPADLMRHDAAAIAFHDWCVALDGLIDGRMDGFLFFSLY